MMAAQLRLPNTELPHHVRPSARIAAPAFWVRRLRVVRELAPGAEHVVREVELRRGFNIVWAPPESAGQNNALFGDGVAGHTAGKSTFCRLIRHVLGERGFAPDHVRRRIRALLPKAWVMAEVVIEAATWVVARPLGIGPRSFCVRSVSLEGALDGGERLAYPVFLDALGDATVGKLSTPRFPSSDKAISWQHVLPWLARDQEARFADFLVWRHSSSGSETPSLDVDDRQFIVRAVLGLISDEERAEQQANAALVADKRKATRLELLFRHQAETDRGRLARAFGRELSVLSTPLFPSEARTELVRMRSDLDSREEALAERDPRTQLQTALEEANQAEGALKALVERVVNDLELADATVTTLTAKNRSDALAALRPSRGYCQVEMSTAREKGCPLAFDRVGEFVTKHSKAAAIDELARARKEAEDLAEGRDKLRLDLHSARQNTKAARLALLSAQTRHEAEAATLRDEQSKLEQLSQLVDAAERTATDAAEKTETIAQLTRSLGASYKRQRELREERLRAIDLFSARFGYVVRAMLGDRVRGHVETSGRSLTLTVEEHGVRESAAIATVKLLAFDLAAMVSGLEGDGAHPRFLLHDGPREADMAPDVYARLFLFARELEKCFEGEPTFQYILTTTTNPPDDFVQPDTPWVRLRLAGAPAEHRLLRIDL